MSDPFVGEIRMVGFAFAPLDWAACDGQLLPISQNAALFSLLGTSYGGDGKSTFALPNLQGCVPMDYGSGVGLTPRNIGDTGGEATVILTPTEIPAHSHGLNADSTEGAQASPTGGLWAAGAVPRRGSPTDLYASGAATTLMAANTALLTGGGQPHNNLQPYLALYFVISLAGIFPARG
jgi:microcystin-dependent protein